MGWYTIFNQVTSVQEFNNYTKMHKQLKRKTIEEKRRLSRTNQVMQVLNATEIAQNKQAHTNNDKRRKKRREKKMDEKRLNKLQP